MMRSLRLIHIESPLPKAAQETSQKMGLAVNRDKALLTALMTQWGESNEEDTEEEEVTLILLTIPHSEST